MTGTLSKATSFPLSSHRKSWYGLLEAEKLGCRVAFRGRNFVPSSIKSAAARVVDPVNVDYP